MSLLDLREGGSEFREKEAALVFWADRPHYVVMGLQVELIDCRISHSI